MATFSTSLLSSNLNLQDWRNILNTTVGVVNSSIKYVMCKKDCDNDVYHKSFGKITTTSTSTVIFTTKSIAGKRTYLLDTDIDYPKTNYLLYINGELQYPEDWIFSDANGNIATSNISYITIKRSMGITLSKQTIELAFIEELNQSESLERKYKIIKTEDGYLTDAETFLQYSKDEMDEIVSINVALAKSRKGYL